MIDMIDMIESELQEDEPAEFSDELSDESLDRATALLCCYSGCHR
jgi:hypothetical protein